MSSNLTPTEHSIVEELPATSDGLGDELFDGETGRVYDHIRNIRGKGWQLKQDPGGRYEVVEAPSADHTNTVVQTRQTSEHKATLTRKAKQSLKELEQEIKPLRKQVGPAIADGGMVALTGHQDVVAHITDVHFGDVVYDLNNDEVFNSDICELRVREYFDQLHDVADVREALGETIDTVHVLLGGDIVTNEAIFDGQAWEVDEHIRQQLKRATAVLDDEIERLSERFPSVQIVCQHGNHGEFRVDGSSKHANADDLLYDRLETLAVSNEYDNVRFVMSERTDHTNFEMRGGEMKGHLRHGHHVPKHLGTSSPKSTWGAHLNAHGFDNAYIGHTHENREEPIQGRRVFRSGSFKDAGEYANEMGAYNRPLVNIHGVSDSAPVTWKEYIYYGDEQ